MIKLDFRIYAETIPLNGPHSDEEYMLGLFNGFQNFLVNEVDFSGEVALLHFARSLKLSVHRLALTNYEFAFQDLDSQWTLHFVKKDQSVEVYEKEEGSPMQAKRATVGYSELVSAIDTHAASLFDCCSQLCPTLEAEIGDWWRAK